MGNTRKPKRPGPLQQALAARTNLRTYHDIAVAPSEEVEAAQRKLEAVHQLQMATMLKDDPAMRQRVEELVAKAQADRDACFHRIWFRGLDLDEFDALVALHPPTEEQAAEDPDAVWNDDTFLYALLEECVEEADGTPGGLTAADWQAELEAPKKWSRSERQRVIRMALSAQQQTMADAVPKG